MTFEEIRAEYETQGGGWIFDLVHNKVSKYYGDIPPSLFWVPWMELLNSFLQDQIAFEYQIIEFGRDIAERQYNVLLKKTEEAYTAVMDDFSGANINKTRKILLERFDLITEKERGTQAYFDEFEVSFEGERKNRIVEADLCLKFRLELKQRLFGNNADNPPPPVAASTGAKGPTERQKKALDELAKLLGDGNVVVEWAIGEAAKKANYSVDNVWKLYGKVRLGVLRHKRLSVIIAQKKEFD